MKAMLRVLGLSLALVLSVFSTASASTGCYISCPNDPDFYLIQTMYGCCGAISPHDFTCPGGGQAWGYGYDDGSGPQFCM